MLKFNVDEKERVILAIEKPERGPTMLSVRALEDGRLLWSLPMVRALLHDRKSSELNSLSAGLWARSLQWLPSYAATQWRD